MATKKRTDYVNDTRKIKIVIRENPHREGTSRHAAFEAARTAKTVADYAATGNKPKYIAVWKKSGHIQVVRQQAAKPRTVATAEASK